MQPDFDRVLDRSATYSTKWNKFDSDVLPFWVADMDFAAPDFILDAIRERLAHPILGYTEQPKTLNCAFRTWLAHHFAWEVPEEWIVWVPGVVPMLNLAARCNAPGSSLLIPTPVYHPFLGVAAHAGLDHILVPMREKEGWRMDFPAMSFLNDTATTVMMICNPQNPTGRCYSAEELAQLAEFVQQHNLVLVSDEIHCNIIMQDHCQHLPVAACQTAIIQQTISLFAATKVYNIPGLSCAAAVIPDAALRSRFMHERAGLTPGIGPLAYVASEAAFNDRSAWMPRLLDYLRDNLTLVQAALGDRVGPVEATYLAWISIADLNLDDAEAHFASHGVGISPGAQFGAPEYIRFNFGCPKRLLTEGLNRLNTAISAALEA